MCARPADAGWIVRDAPDSAQLRPRRPYDVLRDVSELPDRSGDPDTHRCSVVVLAQGWPHDIRRCVEAVLGHAPVDVAVGILKIGDVHGGASVVDGLAREHPGRVRTWHVERSPGWGAAMGALLRADTAAVQVLLDPSTVFEGDAVTPLLTALDEPRVVAAGWRGVDVDLSDGWRSFTDAGPGEVDALAGHLSPYAGTPPRRSAARLPKARTYRNADLELSLLLREAGGRIVVPPTPLPVRQERHRGYHDTDPAVRGRDGRRTYERLLARFRGRTDILASRKPAESDVAPTGGNGPRG